MTAAVAVADPFASVEAAPRRRGGGPRTPEGKERSRRNALKHGLRSELLLPDDLAAMVGRRRAEMVAELRPETPYQEWLVGEAARASVQGDRCAELLRLDLARLIDRAETSWDADRRLAAEELGARLSKEPGRVAEALEQTPQGADWLIRRWRGLAEAARKNGRWDEAQRTLAFDLLGVPDELRADSFELPPADATPGELVELAEEQAAELEDAKDSDLVALDVSERSMVLLGMPLTEDAVTRRLARYEASCRRELRWALAEFRRLKPEPAAPSRPGPRSGPRRPPARPHPATMSLLPPLPEPDDDGPPEPTARRPTTIHPSAPAPAPSQPGNRRARRAQEKRARLAAKRAAR